MAIVRSQGFYVNEKSTDTSWDRTTVPTRSPLTPYINAIKTWSNLFKSSQKLIYSFNYIRCETFAVNRTAHKHYTKLFNALKRAEQYKVSFQICLRFSWS